MKNRLIADTLETKMPAHAADFEISQSKIEQYKAILGVNALPLAWSEQDISKLGIRSLASLRRDRVVGGGIPFVKEKGRVIYPVLEVIRWLQENLKASTSEVNHSKSLQTKKV